MGDGPWFLERNGKFYGPFTTEKVRTLATGGKINGKTRIARDKSGLDAMHLEAIPEILGDEPPVPVSSPPPSREEPAPQISKDQMEVWFLISGDEKLGPFSLAQLKLRLDAGKLKPHDCVIKEGASNPIEIKLLLPSPTPQKESVKIRPPKKRDDPNAGLHMDMQPIDTESRRFKKRYMAVIALVVVISVVAVMLWPGRKGGPSMFSRLAAQFEESPEVKEVARLQKSPERHAPPPFNALVQQALSTGLYFSYAEVKRLHARDQEIYDHVGPRDYGTLFKGRIARELHYASDNNMGFTFLMDVDNITFAVIIKGPDFGKYRLSDYHISEFSKTALPPLDKPNETVWTTKLVDGVIAKAVWSKQTKDKKARFLDYICVMSELE